VLAGDWGRDFMKFMMSFGLGGGAVRAATPDDWGRVRVFAGDGDCRALLGDD
jgi:hypothetical protein